MAYRNIVIITLACLSTVSNTAAAPSVPATLEVRALNVTRAAFQAGALAIVNDQTVTLDSLDPRVAEMVLELDKEIAAARRRVVDEQIADLLFEAEAKRRRISLQRLLKIEVEQRITAPTAEEIQAIYDSNRQQFGTADLNAARPQIIAYLRQETSKKLLADFAKRLRVKHRVVMGSDINSPNLMPGARLATVAGRVILADSVLELLKPIIYELRMRVYEVEKKAVEQMIYNLLVLDAARRRDVGPEVIIREEITEKLRSPSEEEIAKFYEDNKVRFTSDLASMRMSIANYLEQEQTAKLELALGEKLRTTASVRILLTEPEPPVLAVSTDGDPSRGEVSASVTVVVFTDFQCPSCALNHPIINETISSYGNRVRLVIRDFPLDMHLQAPKAAEAANAAHAQGKFFEYADVLFKNQKALDVGSLKKYATQVGLQRARFDAELDSGVYTAEVDHDVADGLRYGVLGTPTVFVNGVMVRGLSAETLRAAIDRALTKTSGTSTSRN